MENRFLSSLFIDSNFSKTKCCFEEFYSKTLGLVIISNLLNFGLFLFLNTNISIIFATHIFLTLYFSIFRPFDDQRYNKFFVNMLLITEAFLLCVYLPKEICSLWFFSISTFFTWSQFRNKNEIKMRNVLLSISLVNFIAWNFLPNFSSLNFNSETTQLIKTFFRLDSFAFSILTVAYWIKHSERLLEIAQIEKESFDKILDAATIVSITDRNGKIIFGNKKFMEISGYNSSELIGNNHRILKSGLHDENFYKEMWNTISHKKVWTGEVANRSKNGSIYWVQSTIIPTFNVDGDIEKYVSIRFDITAQKEAEEKVIQSEKMTVLGEMAAGIFHEINNPLSIIKTKSQTLQKSIERNTLTMDKVKIGLELMDENIERINKIVRGLRAYSRNADHDPFESCQINELISDSMVLCHDKVKKSNVQLLNLIHMGDFKVDCRKSEIIQIIVNLINNSVDALENSDDPWIKLELKEDNELYSLSVTDSGNGIPKSVVDKMMNPFFTTKAPGKGTGLGLSISTKIAKAHGGDLKYDFESKNTKFILTLPKAKALDLSQAS